MHMTTHRTQSQHQGIHTDTAIHLSGDFKSVWLSTPVVAFEAHLGFETLVNVLNISPAIPRKSSNIGRQSFHVGEKQSGRYLQSLVALTVSSSLSRLGVDSEDAYF